MQLIVAAQPEDLEDAQSLITPLAHIAYRVGSDGRLYRAEDASKISGGTMVIGSDLSEHYFSDSLISDIIAECKTRKFSGILVNFENNELLQQLSKELKAANISLIVHEEWGYEYETATVLVSSAISGGTLKQRLSEAAETFGAERILLDIEPIFKDFLLPAPDGEGKSLSFDEFSELTDRYSSATFYSPELCCNYYTYFESGNTHIVLYDTAGTVKKKLQLAESIKIERAIFIYRETKSILKRILE